MLVIVNNFLLLSHFKHDKINARAIVLQGGLTRYSYGSYGMEVMPMWNHYDFKDMLTFGIFLLALLTFIFSFCK